MRKLLFESLLQSPADRGAARARRCGARRAGPEPRARRAPPARPLAVDPRGRRRLLQRLRAGDPRAQQRLLRPGALRPALRRLAAPRRRAAGHRPGDQEHARGAGAHLCRHARPQVGGGGRRLRARRRHLRRQLRRASAASRRSCRSTSTSAAARRRRPRCSRGCWRWWSRPTAGRGKRSSQLGGGSFWWEQPWHPAMRQGGRKDQAPGRLRRPGGQDVAIV